jgi:hypothetical protein
MSTFTATHDCNNNNTTIKCHSKYTYQLKLPVMSIEEKTRRLLGWIGETSTTSGHKIETSDRKMATNRGGNKRKVPYMRPSGQQQHSALTPPTSPASSNEVRSRIFAFICNTLKCVFNCIYFFRNLAYNCK